MQEFIISAIAYLGLIVGSFLMVLAPEEKKPGMKYFHSIHYILFFFSIILAMIVSERSPLMIIVSIIVGVAYYYMRRHFAYLGYLHYSFLIVFFSSTAYNTLFPIIMFAYGLVVGAYLINLKEKSKSFFKLLPYALSILTTYLFSLVL
ncbi:hypothetical protein GOV09_06450 [Candidatus Woesearchaeota archaeon]|nr:hypothetical protein [Candidatus Woesearchaeota archaeon]